MLSWIRSLLGIMTRGDGVTNKKDGLEGQAHISNTKLSAKARGPLGTVALLLALSIVAIMVMAYLRTTTERGVVTFVVGALCATAVQLVLTIRNMVS